MRVTDPELAVLGQGEYIPERADAARNRARVLSAAAKLFSTPPPGGVTMDAVARSAGVGRATLYRRYPDIASIAVALLDQHERALQGQILSGDPPLGPGAPPAARLVAFYDAMVTLLEDHAPLLLGAEVGRSRFAPGAYGFWVSHVRVLLQAAGLSDPEPMIDLLLAPLAPEVFLHQRQQRGYTLDQIRTALAQLANRVLAGTEDQEPGDT